MNYLVSCHDDHGIKVGDQVADIVTVCVLQATKVSAEITIRFVMVDR